MVVADLLVNSVDICSVGSLDQISRNCQDITKSHNNGDEERIDSIYPTLNKTASFLCQFHSPQRVRDDFEKLGKYEKKEQAKTY